MAASPTASGALDPWNAKHAAADLLTRPLRLLRTAEVRDIEGEASAD
jgi:hypothetical protein